MDPREVELELRPSSHIKKKKNHVHTYTHTHAQLLKRELERTFGGKKNGNEEGLGFYKISPLHLVILSLGTLELLIWKVLIGLLKDYVTSCLPISAHMYFFSFFMFLPPPFLLFPLPYFLFSFLSLRQHLLWAPVEPQTSA